MQFPLTLGVILYLATSIPSLASTMRQTTSPLGETMPQTPVAQTIAQKSWKPVTSESGKFTVMMPGKPVEEKESEDIQDGKINSHSYTVEVSDEVAYLVQYTDFGISLTQVDPKEFFDGAAEGLTSDGGRILENKNITMAGVPGREVKYVDGQGISATVRMLLLGDRFYQLHAITKQETDAKKFFDSFQIIK
jgi:hypothetical protein